jgi:adenine-specific DNA-methyltransferase
MQRFSGRHETILWFTKGNNYNFDLDSIRVPQKYPGKKSYKSPNKGNFSGNVLGKNPSDVWDIPNVKAQHIEKTNILVNFLLPKPRRLIKALTPTMGWFSILYRSWTSGVAAILEKRRFIGAEILPEYYDISLAV